MEAIFNFLLKYPNLYYLHIFLTFKTQKFELKYEGEILNRKIIFIVKIFIDSKITNILL